MNERKDKLFPFGWVLLVVVIMIIAACFLYVNRFKEDKTVDLRASQTDLIDRRENDTTVAAYISYVNDESNTMGLDHDYANTALLKLSGAVNAMARATGYAVKSDLKKADMAAAKITVDPLVVTHADNIRKAADILSGALVNLQQAKYPTLTDEASAVSDAAQQINPNERTLDQKDKVKGFFQNSAELLRKMN